MELRTEKARSELLIMPILMELRRQSRRAVFSGLDFNVDTSSGLSGYCDYLIARGPSVLILEGPILAVVEAQCLAEMVAVRIFNA